MMAAREGPGGACVEHSLSHPSMLGGVKVAGGSPAASLLSSCSQKLESSVPYTAVGWVMIVLWDVRLKHTDT